ncbi:glycerol-1-phosphate dehydrogenase [NAD(P)+] [Paenibacillus sp. J31TS4]|uniref:sn-glycerol-1-phosphate dehydrogenase n=1 Tax=Paenibacillus sp. J31TS4 TaxID=2807195 RepID=UPI001B16763F|nr:sn-glycerol-1-phosphate dehydrogenase [Paenibacillus sp. J31TS4]GIP40397.1 glycerol-1-phosphate dehydrogenase [NAD(P)+] [Paenibacillus sp. J31TS4]
MQPSQISLEAIQARADVCPCGHPHRPLPIRGSVVETGALNRIPSFVREQGWRRVHLVADRRTFAAAGRQLARLLEEAGIVCTHGLVDEDEQGDVIADERSVVQVLIDLPADAEAMLAVGAGTLHDIVRFAASRTQRPFVAVPTAASVDGFASAGAPLIVRGVKRTIQVTPPVAVFADLAVLEKAPRELTAAGFADMLAKYTALADWRFSHIAAGEPYCPLVAELTREALALSLEQAGSLRRGETEGIRGLMEGLLLSGYAMLIADHSRSASGSEHHLSHYWEMELLRTGGKQLLHGAKVGVATALMAGLLRQLAALSEAERDAALARVPVPVAQRLAAHWADAVALAAALPEPAALRELLAQAGAPATPDELGLPREWVARALREAPQLRDRYTGLRFANEAGLVERLAGDWAHASRTR